MSSPTLAWRLQRRALPPWLTHASTAAALLPGGVPFAAWQLTAAAETSPAQRTPTQTLLHGTALSNVKRFLSSALPPPHRPSVFCATVSCPHVALTFSDPVMLEGLHASLSSTEQDACIAESFGAALTAPIATAAASNEALTPPTLQSTCSAPIALTALIEVDCDLTQTHFEPEGPEVTDGGVCTWTGLDAATLLLPICFPYDGAMAYSVPWPRVVAVRGLLLGSVNMLHQSKP